MKQLLALILVCCCHFAAAATDEPLPPEQAYPVSASLLDESRIELRIGVAPGYYLYRNKLSFRLEGPGQLGAVTLPPGEDHEDRFFGRQPIYRAALRLELPLSRPASGPLTLVVHHQGCAESGVCYPPSELPIALSLTNHSSAVELPTRNQPAWMAALDAPQQDLAPAPATAASAAPAPVADSDDGRIARHLREAGLLLNLASFFGFGLLLAFTPCMLPMVPILSGIIVGHGHKISPRRAFALSTAYVLGLAATYALAGVAAALSGQLLSTWLQNAWVLGALALLFVLLALSMFGLFELQLPARWQHRLSSSAHHHGGSLRQLALMGAISALIVGPCVAPPLAGALLYIATTHDVLLGAAALFALGLGMGAPLLALGVAARRLLPRPGAWMEGVKRFFGFLLLATALWLLSPLLPPLLPMLGWGALLICGGVFLRALDSLPADARPRQRLLKALGLLALLAGAVVVVGGLAGSRDPLQPLAGLRGQAASSAPAFARIRSTAELDAALAASTQPVLLDFSADWCVSCKEMEASTFPVAAVAARLAHFTLLRADVTANTPADRELLRRFGLFGPPGILFFPPGRAEETRALRVVGYMAPEAFARRLDAATGDTPQ